MNKSSTSKSIPAPEEDTEDSNDWLVSEGDEDGLEQESGEGYSNAIEVDCEESSGGEAEEFESNVFGLKEFSKFIFKG